MNEDNSKIDDIFKKDVEPITLPPSEGVWAGISNELDKKETLKFKRRAFFFQMVSVSLLLVLAGILINQRVSQEPEKAKNNSQSIPGVRPVQSDKSSHNTSPLVASNNSVVPVHNEQALNEQTPKAVKQDNKVNLVKETPADLNGVQRVKVNNRLTGKTMPAESVVFAERKSGSTANNANAEESGTRAHVNSATEVTSTKEAASTPEVSSAKDVAPTTEVASTTEAVSTNLTNNSSNSQAAAKENTERADTTCTDSAAPPVMPIVSAPPAVSHPRISLFGYFSPQTMGQVVPSTDIAATSKSFSYSAGLKAEYSINDKWSILTGSALSVFSQSIQQTSVFYSDGEDGQQAGYGFNTSYGKVTLPSGFSSISQNNDSIQITASASQTIKYLDVPLLVKYKYSKNKLCLYLFSGVSVNFLLSAKTATQVQDVIQGTTFNQTLNQIDGLRKVNCGLVLGVGMQYILFSHVALGIEPTIMGSIVPISHSMPFSSIPYVLGGNLGICYHF